MNKEEIKIKKAYDRGYIERDRQAREICKTCIYQTRYKELTKKEETLDKVTERKCRKIQFRKSKRSRFF